MAHAADTSTYRITLEFEDAATLARALEHIGDRDAPVMIMGGTVTTGGRTHQLWDGYYASLTRAESEAPAEKYGPPVAMTASDLIGAVRTVAAEHPDRTEKRCRYRDENNDPVCLVGHALARFGWHDQMTGNEENIAAVLIYDWNETVKSTLTQRDWLHHVQKEQDKGATWGEAVRATDHRMGPIG